MECSSKDDVPMECSSRDDVPYRLLNEARSLFNEPRLSDVRFLVDGQTVFGHKLILAMGSPVFESMFSNDSKQHEVIEISDLTSMGFKNALRYIYGFEIDFKLSELYETYLAADRYMLHGFKKALYEFIQIYLNAKNSCLIYDQLLRMGEREEILLDHVRTVIIHSSKEAVESEHFKQIDQRTLISLLSLGELSIDEVDLLSAVSKWIDCELQRLDLPVNGENRRRAFEPIKGYIVFSALTAEQVANCKEIADLLSTEEIGPLLLHLLNRDNRLNIEPRTSRKARMSLRLSSVFISESVMKVGLSNSRAMYLSVNQAVRLTDIFTTYSERVTNLALKILDQNFNEFSLKLERSLNEGKWAFSFKPPLEMRANSLLTLCFSADQKLTNEREEFSKQSQLISKGGVIFNLCPDPAFRLHPVRGVQFF